MSVTRVLAFSSSRAGDSGYLELAAPVIKRFLPATPLTIAFVPFASVEADHEDYLLKVKDGLANSAFNVKLVTKENAKALIQDCDAIMVGGGNTFKLLHDIYRCELIDPIQEKVKSGTPYIGWSAGSNITGLTIGTTNDMPIIEPKSFQALQLFPFQINPHYISVKALHHHGETRDQRLEEFVKMNPGVAVVCLPEGTVLQLEGSLLRYLGEFSGALLEMSKLHKRIVKTEILPGADLSYLL